VAGSATSSASLRTYQLWELNEAKTAFVPLKLSSPKTICGRSCASSGHYKPLCACVDRIFVNLKFVVLAARKNSGLGAPVTRFGGGSGAPDSLNAASLGADSSQQTFLTTPHA
jgi:hypothetical protein